MDNLTDNLVNGLLSDIQTFINKHTLFYLFQRTHILVDHLFYLVVSNTVSQQIKILDDARIDIQYAINVTHCSTLNLLFAISSNCFSAFVLTRNSTRLDRLLSSTPCTRIG